MAENSQMLVMAWDSLRVWVESAILTWGDLRHTQSLSGLKAPSVLEGSESLPDLPGHKENYD